MSTSADLRVGQPIHVVAIGGAAMSAIARYLQQLGFRVSGSDVRQTPTTIALQHEGISVIIGHHERNVGRDVVAVVYSTAVALDNPELVAARQMGIPVLHRSDIMRTIVASKSAVAVVAGTHGKTTTSSMLTEILDACGLNPSFFVGGTSTNLGTNARYEADGEWIVVEGDESDQSFLAFSRTAALVTNIEADHLEHWEHKFERLVEGFERFIDSTAGPVVLCADDDLTAAFAVNRAEASTYGFAANADFRLASYEPIRVGSRIVCVDATGVGETVELQLRGRDMATNAIGAAALANRIGVAWPDAVRALAQFRGVARRFQFRGSYDGVDCYDDYAHTATEIATTLARAREGSWQRVIAVCQPHRYSRIAAHGHEYGAAFRDADIVIVTAIDPAFETPIVGVDAAIVVDSIRAAQPNTEIVYLPEWDALGDLPWRYGNEGDIVVTLGCGTITDVHALWAASAGVRDA